jgi:hypothetical protein
LIETQLSNQRMLIDGKSGERILAAINELMF